MEPTSIPRKNSRTCVRDVGRSKRNAFLSVSTRRKICAVSIAWWTLRTDRCDQRAEAVELPVTDGIARVLEARDILRSLCTEFELGEESTDGRIVAFASATSTKLESDLALGLPSVARLLSAEQQEKTWMDFLMGDRLGPENKQLRMQYDQNVEEILGEMAMLNSQVRSQQTNDVGPSICEYVGSSSCNLAASLDILLLQIPGSWLQRAQSLRNEILLGGI